MSLSSTWHVCEFLGLACLPELTLITSYLVHISVQSQALVALSYLEFKNNVDKAIIYHLSLTEIVHVATILGIFRIFLVSLSHLSHVGRG